MYQIDSKEEAFKLIKKSMKNKAIRSTDFNNVSSRSHTVLQLLVFTEETNQDSIKLVKRSTLSLIDLAGSEKWRSSLSVTSQNNTVNSEIDQQVKEMTNINSSLHVLGNCIAKLIGSDSKHIPYRDSILTRLLQNTLNGNGKSIIIATIHSDDDYMEENWSTLQFASRASRVKVTLQANVGINMNEQSSLQDAQKQIKYLQQQLLELKNSTIYQVPNISEQQQQQLQLIQQCTTCEENLQRIQELENRMREMDLENKKLKEKIKRMKDQVKNLSQNRQSQESINDTFFQNHQGQGIPPQSYPSSYSVSPVVDSESQQIINASMNSAAQFQQQPLSQQVSGIAYSTNPPGNNSGGYNSQQFAQPGQAPSQAQTVSINLNNLNRSTNNAPIAPVFFAPSKLKTGEKCRKHGLEDCVLCSMFGSSGGGGGGGGNSGGGGGGGGDGEDEEDVNDEQQSYTLTRPKSEYKPLSSSSRPLTNHDLPVSNFNFTSSSRGFTPKTPLESSNLPHSRQSSGGLLGFLNEDEKNNFGDIPTTSGKKENICRTHSLRNCLLCANELTFQREIQLTNSMEALMKQTTSVLGNNPFQSSSASFHLQNTPTHHQNISSNPTKLAPLGEIPSNQQNNAQFVSTLDSLENSKVDFAFLDTSKQSIHQYTPHHHHSTNMSTTHLQPMQQSFHQQNNNNNISFTSSIQNKSGFQNSSSFLSQNPLKVSAPPILAPPQPLNVDNYSSNMKNVSPYDAAVAALSAANSLLSSTDFSEAGFPPQDMNNNNGQFKSKRLRELKALSNQPSLGNTTSPAIVETVPSSNPILSGQSINPRRTSTSPAMNNSIPIEPLYIHQQQQQPQQPQQFMNNFQSINPNNHYNQIPRGNNNGFDPNKGIDDGELDEDGEDDIDDGEDYDEDDNHQNYRITSREQTPTEQHRNNHSQMASSAVKGSALKQPRPSSRTKANNNNLAGDKNGLKKKKLKKKKKKVLIPK